MLKNWNNRFINLAREVATWSKDPSKQVGAVIVDNDKHIIGIGFNGLPTGIKDDERILNKEWKLKRVIHAEVNAILNSITKPSYCTMYVTHMPCTHCASVIINARISKLIVPLQTLEHMAKYGEEGKALLLEGGVYVEEVDC